jgi:hypothetical protein
MLFRAFYDIRYILVEEFTGLMPGMDMYWFIGFMLIVGGHMASLLAAASWDSRAGWVGTVIFGLLNGLVFGAASLVAYTSNTLEVISFTASLITGLLAAVASWPQIRAKEA